jgi:hypothetical protein
MSRHVEKRPEPGIAVQGDAIAHDLADGQQELVALRFFASLAQPVRQDLVFPTPASRRCGARKGGTRVGFGLQLVAIGPRDVAWALAAAAVLGQRRGELLRLAADRPFLVEAEVPLLPLPALAEDVLHVPGFLMIAASIRKELSGSLWPGARPKGRREQPRKQGQAEPNRLHRPPQSEYLVKSALLFTSARPDAAAACAPPATTPSQWNVNPTLEQLGRAGSAQRCPLRHGAGRP